MGTATHHFLDGQKDKDQGLAPVVAAGTVALIASLVVVVVASSVVAIIVAINVRQGGRQGKALPTPVVAGGTKRQEATLTSSASASSTAPHAHTWTTAVVSASAALIAAAGLADVVPGADPHALCCCRSPSQSCSRGCSPRCHPAS